MRRTNLRTFVYRLVLLSTFFAIVWFFVSHTSSRAPGRAHLDRLLEGTKKITGPKSGSNCGEVLRHCKLEERIDPSTCNEKAAEQLLQQLLAEPLKRPECRDVRASMAGACPIDCELDTGSFVTVPGKLQTFVTEDPTEKDRCSARGRRTVLMRASCFYK